MQCLTVDIRLTHLNLLSLLEFFLYLNGGKNMNNVIYNYFAHRVDLVNSAKNSDLDGKYLQRGLLKP